MFIVTCHVDEITSIVKERHHLSCRVKIERNSHLLTHETNLFIVECIDRQCNINFLDSSRAQTCVVIPMQS